MTNKKKNFYFDDNEPDTWSILNFHKAWINKYKNNDAGKLQFQKANNALVRVLRLIVDNYRDNKKVEKAKSILNIKVKRGVDIDNFEHHCYNTNIFETELLVNNENNQLLEDYCSLFNNDNVEEISQLIDDHILNEETNFSNFNEINFELEKGILDLTKKSLFNWKDIDNKLLNEVSQLFTNTIAWLPKTAPKILQDKLSMDRLRFINEQELKMTTVFPLIRGIFSKNLIEDKWKEVQSLATNEACNESNNPFQRAKVGHKADMKGILKNTSCKLEALYGEVSGGLGPFGLSIASRKKKYLDKVKLSIMMRDLINKALNNGGILIMITEKSTTNNFFLELEIGFYAMSWFEEIYLFGRIDSCTILSKKNDCYLFEEIYCVLTELESKLKKTEETVRKLHSNDIINKRRLITQENSPILNTNRTPSKH
ncbi:42535_t:CDS:2 [Gigaspora margarita]|uniref:42535_t:CDS:1 n=1 Tax=Gigaspora margarita TaxID=4874 RepID=A0ABN7V1Q6_GIGMA|nr:42535_t:CDS:2 [Gigaspora margarita]